MSKLSSKAKELLRAAVEGDGTILEGRDASGFHVFVNQQDFTKAGDSASQAACHAAFEELRRAGLIQEEADQVYKVSAAGYEACKQLADDPEAPGGNGQREAAEDDRTARVGQGDQPGAADFQSVVLAAVRAYLVSLGRPATEAFSVVVTTAYGLVVRIPEPPESDATT